MAKNTQENSEVKAGWLSGDGTYWLTRYESGASLKICGASAQTIQWAINVWGAAIGKQFTFAPCDSNDGAHVWSYGYAQAQRNSWCNTYPNRAYAISNRSPMVIVDCGGVGRAGAPYLLHEVGHLFGMCDQYPESVANCAYTTNPVKGSVMYSAKTNYLTDDDSNGIRDLAQRLGQGVGLLDDFGDDDPGAAAAGPADDDAIRDDEPSVDPSAFTEAPQDDEGTPTY